MASAFANAIGFLNTLGLYDVVLPFLLTFTIVYAILDKTKVLGTDKFKDHPEMPKKNLNALVAFCIGFLVVASTNLVSIINTTLAQIVLLFIVCVFYLALIGIFFKKDEEVAFEKGPWRTGFMVALLVAILGIFANAIKLADGRSVLEWLHDTITFDFDSGVVAAIILLLLMAGFMAWVMHTPSGKSSGGDAKPKDKKDGGH